MTKLTPEKLEQIAASVHRAEGEAFNSRLMVPTSDIRLLLNEVQRLRSGLMDIASAQPNVIMPQRFASILLHDAVPCELHHLDVTTHLNYVVRVDCVKCGSFMQGSGPRFGMPT